MKKFPVQAIIIGGGASIKEGIETGLWDKIQDKFTIGLNASYKFFTSTLQIFVDLSFWKGFKNKNNRFPGNREGLLANPALKICNKSAVTKEDIQLPNIIPLVANSKASPKEMFEKGVFSPILCGIFSLTVVCNILDKLAGSGEIFLLGYDFGDTGQTDKKGRKVTHFYQENEEAQHRGIGYAEWYKVMTQRNEIRRLFVPFVMDFPNIKIYNVSLISKINVFEKISYETFYKKLKNESICQDCVRKEVKKLLLPISYRYVHNR